MSSQSFSTPNARKKDLEIKTEFSSIRSEHQQSKSRYTENSSYSIDSFLENEEKSIEKTENAVPTPFRLTLGKENYEYCQNKSTKSQRYSDVVSESSIDLGTKDDKSDEKISPFRLTLGKDDYQNFLNKVETPRFVDLKAKNLNQQFVQKKAKIEDLLKQEEKLRKTQKYDLITMQQLKEFSKQRLVLYKQFAMDEQNNEFLNHESSNEGSRNTINSEEYSISNMAKNNLKKQKQLEKDIENQQNLFFDKQFDILKKMIDYSSMIQSQFIENTKKEDSMSFQKNPEKSLQCKFNSKEISLTAEVKNEESIDKILKEIYKLPK